MEQIISQLFYMYNNQGKDMYNNKGMDQVIVGYAKELFDWVCSVTSPEDVGGHFEKFSRRVDELAGAGVHVCFDGRAAESIMKLLDTLKLQSFHPQLHICHHRRILGLIAEELYSQGFITRRHCLEIREKIQQCVLIDRIQPLFQEINQFQTANMHDIRLLWDRYIVYKVDDFWLWIISCNIKHLALIAIFEVTVRLNHRLCEDVLKSPLFQEIKSLYENGSMDKSIISSSADTRTHSRSISSIKDMSKLLEEIAVSNSLALNKFYSLIMKSINGFVGELNAALFVRNQQYFQLFGSVRSKMGLMEDFDIDLTVIFSKERKINYSQPIKANDLDFLEKLMTNIEQQDFPWLVSTYLGRLAPFAYLKLSIDPSYMLQRYKIPNVTKIDITVDGKNGIINSEFIAKFAQKKEVLIFCVLIKLWAKNVDVINSVSPMQGLSSYGLILMCLFFLMFTKQLEFLTNLNNFTVKSYGFKDLYENLQQFYEFYGNDGRFHREKMTVCLIRSPYRYSYDENLIINMYDPLDHSNPGRLTIQYKEKFYRQFTRARIAFQQRDEQLIDRLFKADVRR